MIVVVIVADEVEGFDPDAFRQAMTDHLPTDTDVAMTYGVTGSREEMLAAAANTAADINRTWSP